MLRDASLNLLLLGCEGPQTALAVLRCAAQAAESERGRLLECCFSQNNGTAVRHALHEYAMQSPAALRALLCNSLTPLSAELFTARLEEAQIADNADSEFFGSLYGMLFGDGNEEREAFLRILLARKDDFAKTALHRVVNAVLR